MANLRIGLELPIELLSIEQTFAIGRLAEERGLSSIWVQEGLGKDAVSLLGALATATDSIRLATGPINIYTRTPYLIAMTASTLHEMTLGRFILGLTPGQSTTIETHHGLPLVAPDKVAGRVADVMRIVKGLLAGDELTIDTGAFLLRGAALPIDEPTVVPIYLNARQAEMLEVVGSLLEGAILSIATPAWIRDFAIPHITIGAHQVQRDVSAVDIAYHPILCVSEDEDAAIDAAREAVAPYFKNPIVIDLLRDHGFEHEIGRFERRKRSGEAEFVPNDLVQAVTLVGHPDNVSNRILEFEAAGVTHMILRPYPVADQSAFDAAVQIIDLLRPNP
jgi:alkanesulfonate monooxygenase SsuD/methylene tetrahydromethanopterin reductase-like flavin-dependent oxidoreductase (luciferase family)